jgi:hypothetical protein
VIVVRLAATPIEQGPAVGLGRGFPLVGRKMVGLALVAEARLAHFAAFPAFPGED